MQKAILQYDIERLLPNTFGRKLTTESCNHKLLRAVQEFEEQHLRREKTWRLWSTNPKLFCWARWLCWLFGLPSGLFQLRSTTKPGAWQLEMRRRTSTGCTKRANTRQRQRPFWAKSVTDETQTITQRLSVILTCRHNATLCIVSSSDFWGTTCR